MARGPVDYAVRWDVDAIGTLDEAAFATAVPKISATIVTITFWFQAARLAGIKVLANVGNRRASQAGWSVFLHDRQLVFRAQVDGRNSQQISTPLSGRSPWHHFAGVLDQDRRTITGYLDGSSCGWAENRVADLIEPGAVSDDQRLIIGGYTDAAGGHFDHTFGRQGTGLVDDFRLYPRALQPDEIASFIERGKGWPSAHFEFSQPREGSPAIVQFDASASHDEAGPMAIYYWDFGDGQFGSGSHISHTYAYNGSYQARLTVVNDDYTPDTAQHTIHIQGAGSPPAIVPVFVNGSEGYACYRIPSIIRAINGDLVAFAEGRVANCSDSTPIMRIVCKRSSDNGHSWGLLQVVARNILGDHEYGCMNGSPVVDRVQGTGRIVVVFNKKEFSEWDIAWGKGINRTFCVFSDDHGRTWHGEKDITLSVHKPYNPSYVDVYPDAARPENKEAGWRKQVPLPGHAIQLCGLGGHPQTRGRLFFAASYTMGDDSIFDAYNYAFWSDDLGQSWQKSGPLSYRRDGSSAKGLNEAMAVELENGSMLLNSRNYQGDEVVGRRAVATASFDNAGDLHFQPADNDPALIDSGVQATLIRYTRSDEGQYGGKSRLLFANPNHPRARINMTVRLSYDEGQTWPVSKVIDPGPAAYSDLVVLENMDIGLLYEQGNQGGIVYTSFTLEWLSGGHDLLHGTGAIHPS